MKLKKYSSKTRRQRNWRRCHLGRLSCFPSLDRRSPSLLRSIWSLHYWSLHFLLNRQWFRINQVINPEPRTFEGVKGYIANNGANITPGFYRNYHYISDNTNNNVHIHQVRSRANPPIGSLQKLKNGRSSSSLLDVTCWMFSK